MTTNQTTTPVEHLRAGDTFRTVTYAGEVLAEIRTATGAPTPVSGATIPFVGWSVPTAAGAYMTTPDGRVVVTNQTPRAIIIKLDRNGTRRAQYLSRTQIRMFPMPIEQADFMIAMGEGVLCDRHPITGAPIRGALRLVRTEK